jgi:FdhD protein
MGTPYRIPQMTQAGQPPCHGVPVTDEYGNEQDTFIANEHPLTLYLNKREIVTLMTLGGQPELLAIGYLRNQGIVKNIEELLAVQVDWDTESVAVVTREMPSGLDEKLSRRTVTTGCGQGTVFGDMMESLDKLHLPRVRLPQSTLYGVLRNLSSHNEVYRQAGAVHGCALCREEQPLVFIEDVGRHNAVDAIAGQMWLDGEDGADKIFYTTGRLTSEMVIKVAQMGIPIALSRSGVTRMGLELAQKVGLTMIARAKGQHFLAFSGRENIVFDAIPEPRGEKLPARLAREG